MAKNNFSIKEILIEDKQGQEKKVFVVRWENTAQSFNSKEEAQKFIDNFGKTVNKNL